jgi:hypothetical protein
MLKPNFFKWVSIFFMKQSPSLPSCGLSQRELNSLVLSGLVIHTSIKDQEGPKKLPGGPHEVPTRFPGGPQEVPRKQGNQLMKKNTYLIEKIWL